MAVQDDSARLPARVYGGEDPQWRARRASAWARPGCCLSPGMLPPRRLGGGEPGAADQAAGQGVGGLAVGVGLLAADERVQVAFGALEQPVRAAGKIESHLRT